MKPIFQPWGRQAGHGAALVFQIDPGVASSIVRFVLYTVSQRYYAAVDILKGHVEVGRGPPVRSESRNVRCLCHFHISVVCVV